MKVKKIPVPAGSLIGKMPGADYTDAFRVEFERDIPASADDLSVAFGRTGRRGWSGCSGGGMPSCGWSA